MSPPISNAVARGAAVAPGQAGANALRRGRCPSIAEPMQTGDGLLARLAPRAPLPMDAFVALCLASERHGNGIVEVTQRGSIQIRGLTASSAPIFARSVDSFELGDDSRPPVLIPPLLGLEAAESFDLQELVAELRRTLAAGPYLASLGPKVSVLVDGGGTLHLDAISADIRVRALSASELHVSVGGNAHTATSLGWARPQQVPAVVDALLAWIADRGMQARAKDLTGARDIDAVRALLADRINRGAAHPPRLPAEPIGQHLLKNGQMALGVGLAFGYTHTAILQRFARAAGASGARSIHPAPGRALLVIGLSRVAADKLAAVAADAGFIVEPNDARRYVVACAGSPACASATLSTRELAPAIAQAAKPWLDNSTTVHLSGCAKGCAHSGAAALTLVGPDRLILGGRAGDAPHGSTPPESLVAGLERLSAELARGQSGCEPGAARLARLGKARVIECLAGVARSA